MATRALTCWRQDPQENQSWHLSSRSLGICCTRTHRGTILSYLTYLYLSILLRPFTTTNMDEIGNIKQANSIIINPTTCKCKIVCNNIILNVYMYVSWCTRWKLWSNEVLCLFSDFIIKRIEKYLQALQI